MKTKTEHNSTCKTCTAEGKPKHFTSASDYDAHVKTHAVKVAPAKRTRKAKG